MKLKSSPFWRIIKNLLGLFSVIFFVLVLGGIVLFADYIHDFPRPEKFSESQFAEPTRIYDRTGDVLLYSMINEENRTLVPLEDVSPLLQQAIIATEDKNFYSHRGIDIPSIVRAISTDLKMRAPVQGASTITQQLIRSYFLNNDKTLRRKTKEIILTIGLEKKYSKEQILEWYLNQIPLGSNFYGVETASRGYFNKSAKEVSLSEAATLAALIKAPSALSPYSKNLSGLLARKDYVLSRMVEEGYISLAEKEKTQEEEVVFNDPVLFNKAIHFTLEVKKELEEKYGLSYLQREGLKVYTSLDWNLQQQAQETMESAIEDNKLYHIYNGALVAIEPKTGQILSMVGSKNYFAESYPANCENTPAQCLFNPKFNVATLGKRHPGSALKPFVYATAFQKGFSDNYIVVDEKTDFGIWGEERYIPKNYDNFFRGPITLRSALAQSLNIPAVKVFMNLAGIEDSLTTMRQSGITSDLPAVPSIVLGGGEIKLIDLTSAYGVFATKGLRVPPVYIVKIEDRENNVIYSSYSTNHRRVLSQETAQTITSILSDEDARAPMFGYNSNLYIPGYDVAVKTGTTQKYIDFWSVGYNEDLVVGLWMGNNNQEPMAHIPSVISAGKTWNEFTQYALQYLDKQKSSGE
jgi:1A family penicillin-binding protein